jgi:hypothetical protein
MKRWNRAQISSGVFAGIRDTSFARFFRDGLGL